MLVEQVSHPDDFTWATYRLRKEARWHDGKPVTPEDVIFSLEQLKKLSPRYGSYYNHVVKAEKVGDQDVKFTFDQPGNRELPVIVGQLMVLPKHWWEGTDKDGKKRDISATTLEPPLGSGPYRIKDFSPGRTLVLERVKDYWGEKLPVNIGQNNFDELRYEYLPRQHRCAGGFQGRPGRLDPGEQRQAVGDGLRFPGGARQARAARGISDACVAAACKASSSTCAATCSRMRASVARSTTPTTSRR